ncbi:DUF4153 domain-containing protein [Pantoea sp. MBD-2R]|uniref:DUF4153 domain-containing protein n=1 Tax=Pantoea sp. MBD-2R TaxID=3141540 RepID=UPI003183A63E
MLPKGVLPASTRWMIIIIGLFAGLLWALPDGLSLHERYAVYLPPLSLGAASVLAFTLTRPGAIKPWLCALAILPVIALMTGWLRWNFPTLPQGEFNFRNICAVIFMLSMLMPAVQAFCNKSEESEGKVQMSVDIADALWRNTFTLGMTGIITVLFWLVLLIWSKLFSAIGITFFDWLFFNNVFFAPMATGMVIAGSIGYCKGMASPVSVYRQLVTLAASALLPLHAIVSLLFLACLPLTGLAGLPHALSAATILLTITLMMLVFSAVVDKRALSASFWRRGMGRIVLIAQFLTPLLAALAGWALWIRINEYGWTVERVYGVAIALIAFIGSLLLVWFQRRAWSQGAGSMKTYTALMLGLTALGCFLLHTPVADPYRIEIKNQLARFKQGTAKASEMDIYSFSTAGRRGMQALQTVNQHPQWLYSPADQKQMLVQLLAEKTGKTYQQADVGELQRSIPLRTGSEAPPESWWQSQANYLDHSLATCMVDKDTCLLWMQDLNNDGSLEVLLYNRNQQEIVIYKTGEEGWRQTGSLSLRDKDPNIEKSIREEVPGTALKPWRDLKIDGHRYPVQYYGNDDE